MMQYLQYSFEKLETETSHQLIALLTDAGFEGFEELPGKLLAFVPVDGIDQEVLKGVLALFPGIHFQETLIEPQNWNQVWETSFEPVRINDFAGIRASFHEPMLDVKHELIITPKMSFGTGHHATTYLMILLMEKLNLQNKSLIDFGTGTGVLAILAEKLGAEKILAIDHDAWSIENAAENISANHCTKITLQKADALPQTERVDCMLANINLHIILENLPAMHASLQPGADLLLSGLLQSDEPQIIPAIEAAGFTVLERIHKAGWMAIHSVSE